MMFLTCIVMEVLLTRDREGELYHIERLRDKDVHI